MAVSLLNQGSENLNFFYQRINSNEEIWKYLIKELKDRQANKFDLVEQITLMFKLNACQVNKLLENFQTLDLLIINSDNSVRLNVD